MRQLARVLRMRSPRSACSLLLRLLIPRPPPRRRSIGSRSGARSSFPIATPRRRSRTRTAKAASSGYSVDLCHARRGCDPEAARDSRAQDRVGVGRGGDAPRRGRHRQGRRRLRDDDDQPVAHGEGRFQRADLVDGGGVLVRATKKPIGMADLKGKRIAVIARHDHRAGARPRVELARRAGDARAGHEQPPRAWRCSIAAEVDGYAGDRDRAREPQAARAESRRARVRHRRLFLRAVRDRRAAATIPISSSR